LKFSTNEKSIHLGSLPLNLITYSGYAGKLEEEEIRVDIISGGVEDWANEWVVPAIKIKTEPSKEEYAKSAFPKFAAIFEKFLSTSATGYVANTPHITYADFALYDVLEKQQALLGIHALDPFPCLTKFIQKIRARETLRDYFASDRRMKHII